MDRRAERLALIEIEGRDGRVGRTVDVLHWPLTLGRALDNDIVIDDPHMAARHARIAVAGDGVLALEVLQTRNGVVHGGRRLAAGETLDLPPGGTALQLGGTRLRLRLAGEVLAPERPLPTLPGGRMLPLLAGLVLAALLTAQHWIGLDPGADYSAWLPLLVATPLALVAWCGAWALMSKLFQHRFDFGGHLRIALPWMLALGLADVLLPQLAASLGARWLWQLSPLLQALLTVLLVRAHLVHVLPQFSRAVTASVTALALAGTAIVLARTQRANDSFSNAPYMSTLPMPALRLAGTVPVSNLVDAMGPLSTQLAARVKKAREDDPDDGGDGSTD